jgi:hypothetical protein
VRGELLWNHVYWMAPPLLLPVAFEINELADSLPRQRTRHDLIAVDQLSLAGDTPGAPNATPTGAPARATR